MTDRTAIHSLKRKRKRRREQHAWTCADCGSNDIACIDSRPNHDGVRRRRQCQGCGRRFTTVETIADYSQPMDWEI